MSHSAPTVSPVSDPLGLSQRSLATKVIVVITASLFLAAISQVRVPMPPVPLTIQTYGIVLLGALLGPKLALAAVLTWFAQAAVGLPVLAGSTGGAHKFIGNTAGYLWAYPLMVVLVGMVAQAVKGQFRIIAIAAAMIGASLLCLAMGGAWLATLYGPEIAWTSGIAPFIVGDALKAGLAAATIAVWPKRKTG